MAGQWKLPLSASQANSRNFYFGSSSATAWCNDLSHRNHVKVENRIAMGHRRVPIEDKVRPAPPALFARTAPRSFPSLLLPSEVDSSPVQVVPPTPWATQYDAMMQPYSPFANRPEVPTVRPRTAMLLMRRMLLSDHSAGKAWEAAYSDVPSKAVIPAVSRPILARREVVERRAESPLSPVNQRRKPGGFNRCYGDENVVGEGTINMIQEEEEMAEELDRGGMTPLRARAWAASRCGSPMGPSASPSASGFMMPASFEVLLSEKDIAEERLSKMWESGRRDKPRSPFGRSVSEQEAGARRKLLEDRSSSSPSDATYVARDWLMPDGQHNDGPFVNLDRDKGHEFNRSRSVPHVLCSCLGIELDCVPTTVPGRENGLRAPSSAPPVISVQLPPYLEHQASLRETFLFRRGM